MNKKNFGITTEKTTLIANEILETIHPKELWVRVFLPANDLINVDNLVVISAKKKKNKTINIFKKIKREHKSTRNTHIRDEFDLREFVRGGHGSAKRLTQRTTELPRILQVYNDVNDGNDNDDDNDDDDDD